MQVLINTVNGLKTVSYLDQVSFCGLSGRFKILIDRKTSKNLKQLRKLKGTN